MEGLTSSSGLKKKYAGVILSPGEEWAKGVRDLSHRLNLWSNAFLKLHTFMTLEAKRVGSALLLGGSEELIELQREESAAFDALGEAHVALLMWRAKVLEMMLMRDNPDLYDEKSGRGH